jgi:hypothetical protein
LVIEGERPEGLLYEPDFVNAEEEADLVGLLELRERCAALAGVAADELAQTLASRHRQEQESAGTATRPCSE